MKFKRVYICLVLLAVVGLFLRGIGTSHAAANLSVDNNDETVQNQAVTANQDLTVFTGSIENTGDSDATIDAFEFDFNAGPQIPSDDVDTITVSFGGSDTDIDVDGGHSLDADFNPPSGVSLDAGKKKDYTVIVTMVDGPEHDLEFSLDFDNIIATEDLTGNPPDGGDIPETPSNVITVKNLVESYGQVDDEGIPRILAAESDRIPLIHMEFAGQNNAEGDGQTARFQRISFRIREILGKVIPGGSTSDAYGDFASVSLLRSDAEEFGEGSREVLYTIDRFQLPSSNNPSDSYVIDFARDTDTADGNDIWPPDEDEEFFSQTTDESHYYVTISTNQGWDTTSAAPNSQFFGFGDAWDAWVDTDAIEIQTRSTSTIARPDTIVTNSDIADTSIDVTRGIQGPIYNSVENVSSFTVAGDSWPIDKLGADPVGAPNDNTGLDFLPIPLVEFTALGTSENGEKPTTLDSITLTFPNTSADFVPEEDLRKLTDTMKSGLSLWRNTPGTSSYSHGDELIPISPEFSNWESDTVVRLVLQSGYTLPSPQDTLNSPDEDLETDRGLLNGNIYKTFYVSFLMDRTQNFPDTFTAKLPLGKIEFSQGNSVRDDALPTFTPQRQPLPDTSSLPHTVTSGTQVAQPVTSFFTQLTSDSTEIGAPSEPVPLIGFNLRDFGDAAGTEAVLDRVDIIFERSDTETDFRATTDLKSLADSGVALYMDNNSSPRNKSGVFQPDVDVPVPLDLNNSTKNATADGDNDDPHVKLEVDHGPSPTPVIPDDDSGDSEGADYFLVVETSDNASNLDTFQAAIGNQGIGDDVVPRLQFAEKGNTVNKFSSIFAPGDIAETERFFGDMIEVNTISAQNINPLTTPGEEIGVGGSDQELFGLDITDGDNGDQTLDNVDLTFNFFESASNKSDTGDIAELTEDEKSGVVLWEDNGNGSFEPDRDRPVPLTNPTWTVFDDTAQVNVTPDSPLEIPDTNDGDDDFYLSVKASNEIELGDTFSATVRGGDIQYSVENSPDDKSGTTNIITAGLPILLNNRVESPRESIRSAETILDVLGINTADQGKGEDFTEVTVNFNDVGASNFSLGDLTDLSGDSTSGVSIWRDDGNGSFSPEDDSLLTPTNTPSFSGKSVKFDFRDSDSDTDIPNNLDNNDDFFVAIRVSETISHGDDFTAEIRSGDFQTTRFSNDEDVESNPVVFGSANAYDVQISDTDFFSNKLTAEVTVPGQDTVALRLATDDQVNDSPAGYDEVATRTADQDDGSIYTFKDISVSIAADTVGIVARGFNDTGPTDYSDKNTFTRDELLGIDLTGANRPPGSDLSKADAMAADEEFGIAVFGDKGGSNDNSDDPVFNPNRGESLKIIPPVDSTVTVEIYNLEQTQVYKTSTSIPGEPAEWHGTGNNVSTVNNGVYIVRVKSGDEVKSFPVVVLK